MLRIVAVAYEVVRELRPFLDSLKRLDTSEGSPQIGKRRALHYSYALGSARESWTCLELCSALGCIDSIEPYRTRFNHIIGTPMIVLHGKRVA